MRFIIETTVTLNYRANGCVAFTPADAEALVDLDESFPLVKSGVVVLHECGLDIFECQASDHETTANLAFTVYTEIYGTDADLKKALDDGWLTWPEELETEEMGNEGRPLVLANSEFENKVRDDLTTGGNP